MIKAVAAAENGEEPVRGEEAAAEPPTRPRARPRRGEDADGEESSISLAAMECS